MIRKFIIEAVSFLLIVLFIYAAVSKILDFSNFRVQLGKSPLLALFASTIAVAVPTLEILISFILIFKRTRKLGLYASFALLMIFTFYLIVILNYSYYIPCSCGGILQGLSWKAHIIFNSLFIGATALAILIYHEPGATIETTMTFV
ncbi:MauE/DoxX family redox-associated membrane protein [Mucilaginibacter boryungensis]|uniref:Methylamine utilisation protein MauE domain-containing protein n=1 Tax=Mucilaginibacter boryungensis TaxID=768480 RepID=A0ABR9XLI0_9SPHI|nr:hypothetical protein [Mucilaginibacter boryungensis]